MENCRQLSVVAEANLNIETFVQAAVALRDLRCSKNLTMIQRWAEVPGAQLVETSMLRALGLHVCDAAMATTNLVFSWCCSLLKKGCADDLLSLPASTRAKFGHASEAALSAASILKARHAKGEEDEASLLRPAKIDAWCESRATLREAIHQTQQLTSIDVKVLQEVLPDIADCVAKHREVLATNLGKLVVTWDSLLVASKSFIETTKPLEDCIEKWNFPQEAQSLLVDDDDSPEGVRNQAACQKAVEDLEQLRSMENIISCVDDVAKLADDQVLERKVAVQLQKCMATGDMFGSNALAQAIMRVMAARTLLEEGVASSVVANLSQYISTFLKVTKKKCQSKSRTGWGRY